VDVATGATSAFQVADVALAANQGNRFWVGSADDETGAVVALLSGGGDELACWQFPSSAEAGAPSPLAYVGSVAVDGDTAYVLSTSYLPASPDQPTPGERLTLHRLAADGARTDVALQATPDEVTSTLPRLVAADAASVWVWEVLLSARPDRPDRLVRYDAATGALLWRQDAPPVNDFFDTRVFPGADGALTLVCQVPAAGGPPGPDALVTVIRYAPDGAVTSTATLPGPHQFWQAAAAGDGWVYARTLSRAAPDGGVPAPNLWGFPPDGGAPALLVDVGVILARLTALPAGVVATPGYPSEPALLLAGGTATRLDRPVIALTDDWEVTYLPDSTSQPDPFTLAGYRR
jgi:hypothetical protein